MPILAIDHIQIAAPPRCEDAARHFFGNLLGLQEISKPEALRKRGGCWFAVGPAQLHIGVETDFRPAKKAHPAFAVTNIDELFAALSQAGVPCSWDENRGLLRRFFAEDPWGNRLEFTEPSLGHTEST